MPLSLTVTEGVLAKENETVAISQLTDAMLKWHGLANNALMKANITAQLHVLPQNHTFAGGQTFSGVWIEWKVPSFAFADKEIQQGYCAEATEILYRLSNGRQPKNNIYVNVVHAVDGAWNFEGKAMSNEEIAEAIAQSI